MTNILKKGLIILGIYVFLLMYLFYASNRIEILENKNDDSVPVAVNLKR